MGVIMQVTVTDARVGLDRHAEAQGVTDTNITPW